MAPFDPRLYKRYLVVFNLFRKDCIRLRDTSGLLEGNYADGRRLATIYGMDEVKSKAKALRTVVQQQLKVLDR